MDVETSKHLEEADPKPPEGPRPGPSGARGAGRTWLALGLAFTIAWAIFLIAKGMVGPGAGLTPPELETARLSMPADYRWNLLDLDDRPFPLSKYEGKAILLNIWSTSCGPCIEEMPTLAALAANPSLREKGVVFLCVATDESSRQIRDFLEGKTWGMTFARAADVPPDVYLTDGIPATFLISPEGRIVAVVEGSAKWDEPSVVAYLEKLATPIGPKK